MTRREIAIEKAKFVDASEKKLMRATTAAERILLEAIFDELFKILGENGGKLVSEIGRELKLSSAIEMVFRNFNQNENLAIINSISFAMIEIGTLNKKYFDTTKRRHEEFKSIYKEVDEQMKARVGLASNNKLVSGGYLDTLLHDTGLKNAVLSATRSAFGNSAVTLRDYMKTIRETVVGNEQHMGGLSSHYRTFAHDTYSQFDSEYGNKVAIKLGINAAVYSGGLIKESRDFCIKKDGKVFTRKEIKNFINDPDLLMTKAEKRAGKAFDYVPERDKGRWECRHHYDWIPDDEAILMRPDLKNLPAAEWV